MAGLGLGLEEVEGSPRAYGRGQAGGHELRVEGLAPTAVPEREKGGGGGGGGGVGTKAKRRKATRYDITAVYDILLLYPHPAPTTILTHMHSLHCKK